MDVSVSPGVPVFCDVGPHEGKYRIRVTGDVYLTSEEHKRYSELGLHIGFGFMSEDDSEGSDSDSRNGNPHSSGSNPAVRPQSQNSHTSSESSSPQNIPGHAR